MLAALPAAAWWAQELHPEILRAAREREGAWEVVSYERSLGFKSFREWLMSMVGFVAEVKTVSIVLTEKEFSTLFVSAKQAWVAKAKPNILAATVNTEANTLWRSGSVEHIALKMLAPDLILRLVSGGFCGHGVVSWLWMPMEWFRRRWASCPTTRRTELSFSLTSVPGNHVARNRWEM
jgi:hypothetical protein